MVLNQIKTNLVAKGVDFLKFGRACCEKIAYNCISIYFSEAESECNNSETGSIITNPAFQRSRYRNNQIHRNYEQKDK